MSVRKIGILCIKINCLLVALFLLVSCFTVVDDYCISDNYFALDPIEGKLNSLDKKNIFNYLINNSGINIDQNNNKVIQLSISVSKISSVLSSNSTASMNNFVFNVKYKIYDKDKKMVVDNGKFVIFDTLSISKNRFVNYSTEQDLFSNSFDSLSVKLKSRVDLFLNKHLCK